MGLLAICTALAPKDGDTEQFLSETSPIARHSRNNFGRKHWKAGRALRLALIIGL
jgi:hypothetical protein